MMRAGLDFRDSAGGQMHRCRGVRGDLEVEDQLTAFAFPDALDFATWMFITRAHPVERLAIRIAGNAGPVWMKDDLLESGSIGVDARERLESPLHHCAERIMAERIHRSVVFARGTVEAMLFRKRIPAFPYACRA